MSGSTIGGAIARAVGAIMPSRDTRDEITDVLYGLGQLTLASIQVPPQNLNIDPNIVEFQLGNVGRISILFEKKYPFSKMSTAFTQELIFALSNYDRHDLSYSLNKLFNVRIDSNTTLDDTSWSDLKELFAHHLTLKVVGQFLWGNYKRSRNGQIKAAYRFLVGLQLVFRKDLKLPSFQSFSEQFENSEAVFSQVEAHLVQCFQGDLNLPPSLFLELALVTSEQNFQEAPFLLSYVDKAQFMRHCEECLINLSFAKWPEKAYVMRQISKHHLSAEELSQLLNSTLRSKDSKTKDVGTLFCDLFNPQTLPTDRVRFIEKLKVLMPALSANDIKAIFHCLHEPLTQTGSHGDWEGSCSLNFERVYFFDSIIIGYKKNEMGATFETVAGYDLKSKKLLWENRINNFFNNSECDLIAKTPFGLAIGRGEYLIILEPKDGLIVQTVQLPCSVDTDSTLYCTPSGFCYLFAWQNSERNLWGGQFTKDGWETKFSLPAPVGFFRSHDESISFAMSLEKLSVITRDGLVRESEDYDSFIIKNEKIYMLRFLAQQETYQLSIDAIVNSDNSVSKELISFEGNTTNLSSSSISFNRNPTHHRLLAITEKGTAILGSFTTSEKEFYFLDLKTRELKATKRKVSTETRDEIVSYLIDSKNGEVWTWTMSNRELWKHSPDKSEYIGKLHCNKNTRLVYLDEYATLYFIEGRPW